jgi:hypothetical protein
MILIRPKNRDHIHTYVYTYQAIWMENMTVYIVILLTEQPTTVIRYVVHTFTASPHSPVLTVGQYHLCSRGDKEPGTHRGTASPLQGRKMAMSSL